MYDLDNANFGILVEACFICYAVSKRLVLTSLFLAGSSARFCRGFLCSSHLLIRCYWHNSQPLLALSDTLMQK